MVVDINPFLRFLLLSGNKACRHPGVLNVPDVAEARKGGRSMFRVLTRIPAGFFPEYAVYVYHRPENHLEGQGDWEMRGVTRDLRVAVREARSLYDSRNFRRVEVKRHLSASVSGERRVDVRTLVAHGAETLSGEGSSWRWLAAVAMSALVVAGSAFAMLNSGSLN